MKLLDAEWGDDETGSNPHTGNSEAAQSRVTKAEHAQKKASTLFGVNTEEFSKLTDRTREGEGGAGAVSSGGGWLTFCSHGCSRLCSRGDPFMGENAHGMPFEAIPLAPSHAVSSEKGSRVAGFGEKGRCVA